MDSKHNWIYLYKHLLHYAYIISPAEDRQQFIEREQQLYGALSSLITDTSVLRDYAAAAILIMKVRKGCYVDC
jgi:hypothetical protein